MAYHWNKLLKSGEIKKVGYALYGVGEKTSVEPTINIHAIQLTMPILKDESKPEFWDKAVKMNGWTAYYKAINKPIGLTIQKNTNNVQVQVWARDVTKPEEIESLMLRAGYYAWHYLKTKAHVDVDIFQVEKKNVEIAVRDETPSKVMGTKDVVRVDLGRPASKVFEADKPKAAEAWADPTPYPCVETNDIEYIERYLRAPERVDQIIKTQAEFAENLKLHLEVLTKLGKAVDELRDAVKDRGLK
jgi:hypothetical protein